VAKRRGRGEDSVFYDHEGTPCKDATFHLSCRGRWRGQIDLGRDATGKRHFRRVSGRTKTEVYGKLDAAHKEIDRGVTTSATYTVTQAVEDWLTDVMALAVACLAMVIVMLVQLGAAAGVR